jgi:NIPSNAP
MEAQLRIYTVKPGRLDAFVEEWKANVAALRERLGFRILGPWVDRETSTFVWLLEYDGDLAAADARYYASEERRSLEPDPARHLERVETRPLHRVEGADAAE